jgi:arginase
MAIGKSIMIVESPSELGAGKRGGSLGIEALKVAARNQNNRFFGIHKRVEIPHNNHLLDLEDHSSHAKWIHAIKEVFERFVAKMKEELEKGEFPIFLTGDHSTGAAIISGIKTAYPDCRLGVVWIDAHADMHSPYTTPSGNVHGMPLAIALGYDSLEFKRNDPNPANVRLWDALQNIGLPGHKIKPEDLVFIAVRDTEEEENALIAKHGIRNFTVPEIREKGVIQIIKQVEEKLANCDLIFVSFDVDSMDSELVSDGTGTPVKNGLLAHEAESIVNGLLKIPQVCAFEITEINPTLDSKKNKMAEVAFDILLSATATIKASLNKEIKIKA